MASSRLRWLLYGLGLLPLLAGCTPRRVCFDVPTTMTWVDGTTSPMVLRECLPVVQSQP